MTDAPKFSASADKNKEVILDQLVACLKPGARVLEVASGTGQHALYFSERMPEIQWQASDRNLQDFGIEEAFSASSQEGLMPPLTLNVAHWPNLRPKFDAVFSANCIHVMPGRNLASYVRGAAKSLKPEGMLLLYGPFKYAGEFTTKSNADFDAFLKRTYDDGGIRNFETVNELADQEGLVFEKDVAMPANNQFLIWRKPAVVLGGGN